jgi:hypothetical protein
MDFLKDSEDKWAIYSPQEAEEKRIVSRLKIKWTIWTNNRLWKSAQNNIYKLIMFLIHYWHVYQNIELMTSRTNKIV